MKNRGHGKHASKPPKSPKEKYNQQIEAYKNVDKPKKSLQHTSVKDAFK